MSKLQEEQVRIDAEHAKERTEFRTLVNEGIIKIGAVQLADEWQVAPSTIIRWANDDAEPLPRFKAEIVRWLKARLAAQ